MDLTLMLVLLGVAALVLSVAVIWVIVAAIVGIATHPTATSNEKLLWVILTLFLSVIGAILWFTVGRHSVAGAEAPVPYVER